MAAAGSGFAQRTRSDSAGGANESMGHIPRVTAATAGVMRGQDALPQAGRDRQIDESLRRLKTDHIDLVQHHEILDD